MLKVGVIGFGTAGKDVVEALANNELENCKLEAILVRSVDKHRTSQAYGDCFTDNADAFFDNALDVVVETAGHQAVELYGERTLRSGSDLIVISIGALGDAQLHDCLVAAGRETGRKIIVPSAAIAGLDRIAAAAEGPLDFIRLTTRKPVKAWRGTYAEEVVNLDDVVEPTVIYTGNARDSARLFPESVNVSAALSLAGIGFERTEVQVIVDPTIVKNVHEVTAEGKFGSFKVEVQNIPSPDNPKTGYIVAMSVRKVLRSLASPLQIGL